MKELQDKKIERLIKKSVKEAFMSEFMKLRTLVFPYISAREQLDIETRYGKKPTGKSARTLSFEL